VLTPSNETVVPLFFLLKKENAAKDSRV